MFADARRVQDSWLRVYGGRNQTESGSYSIRGTGECGTNLVALDHSTERRLRLRERSLAEGGVGQSPPKEREASWVAGARRAPASLRSEGASRAGLRGASEGANTVPVGAEQRDIAASGCQPLCQVLAPAYGI